MIQVFFNSKNNEVKSKSYGVSALGSVIAKDLDTEYGEVIAFRNKDNKAELFDLQQVIQGPIKLEPITNSEETLSDFLHIMRHDCEHVLAQAVQELFPDVKLSVGAEVPNGFAYDFHTQEPFVPEDLEKIEKRMHEIIDRKYEIIREVWSYDEAKEYFDSKDEVIKLQLLDMFKEKDIQNVTVYKQGNFIDLCRGPHSRSTVGINHFFKLNKLSGAQWGKDKSLQIQRIGGTLWTSQKELDGYLYKIEEAKKRDHRKLAQQMDLYHIEEHSPGMVFWHPRGWYVFNTLQKFIRQFLNEQDYQEVNTPTMLSADLWKKSGHWDTFRENMFCVHDDDKTYAVKPMSCPAHVEIFKSTFMGGVKSYADLPIRIAEFGEVHRNEATGALHGLKRVRKLTQDDGHIFCTPDQIEDEIKLYCDLFRKVYDLFGFEYSVDLSTRPDNKLGDESVWDIAEKALGNAAKYAGFDYKIAEGDGAFYGPKLDFHIKDSLDREWQCCTVQLDFILPERLGATYIDTHGNKQVPVMIHRAIFGSLERFTAILIENFAGYLPLWLAPVKIVIVPLNEKCLDYAKDIKEKLDDMSDFGIMIDDRAEKLGYKIRDWTLNRAIKLFILGEKEMDSQNVTMRDVQSGKVETLSKDEVLGMMKEELKMPK